MPPKYWEKSSFKKLNKTWQKKLEKAGFVDHEEAVQPNYAKSPEKISSTTDRLKTWSTNFFRGRFNRTAYEARVTYYRLAGQFLNDHTFANKVEKEVWEHHSNGLSIVKIASTTSKKIGYVRRIITKLVTLMYENAKVQRASDE